MPLSLEGSKSGTTGAGAVWSRIRRSGSDNWVRASAWATCPSKMRTAALTKFNPAPPPMGMKVVDSSVPANVNSKSVLPVPATGVA